MKSYTRLFYPTPASTLGVFTHPELPLDFSTELDMGRVHPRVGSGRVRLYGSPWIIQNVTLSVIVKFTQFSESLVLLKLFSV